jgi:hypothetical protein
LLPLSHRGTGRSTPFQAVAIAFRQFVEYLAQQGQEIEPAVSHGLN